MYGKNMWILKGYHPFKIISPVQTEMAEMLVKRKRGIGKPKQTKGIGKPTEKRYKKTGVEREDR